MGVNPHPLKTLSKKNPEIRTEIERYLMNQKYLDREGVKSFYDRIGSAQDLQKYYEYPALQELIAHAKFDEATAIFEFGCGTGAFAARLLGELTPQNAIYVGVDISPNMVRLAREKVAPFDERAEIILTDGSLSFDYSDCRFDRFVVNYVIDLLPNEDTVSLVKEANRLLFPGGILSIVSLGYGDTAVSHLISSVWSKLCDLTPAVVGGCRPINLNPYIDTQDWSVVFETKISALGVSSQVMIAQKITG